MPPDRSYRLSVLRFWRRFLPALLPPRFQPCSNSFSMHPSRQARVRFVRSPRTSRVTESQPVTRRHTCPPMFFSNLAWPASRTLLGLKRLIASPSMPPSWHSWSGCCCLAGRLNGRGDVRRITRYPWWNETSFECKPTSPPSFGTVRLFLRQRLLKKPVAGEVRMNHRDHVNLLRSAVVSEGGIWADIGSGTGAFTLALAELIGPNGVIHFVDKDNRALQEQNLALQARFPKVQVQPIKGDFTRPLDLPRLDGIVIANALHFIPPRRKREVVRLLKGYLRPHGSFILVEYNVDVGNLWVPFPLTYASWEALAQQCGFTHTRLLATVSSRLLKEFYSAESW